MSSQEFKTVIKPRSGWFDINLKELIEYKDLVFIFVKRTFTANYKQTILGPAWAIIQPFLTTVIFTVVFGNIAGLNNTGVPSFVFYFCANITWAYFANCLTATSYTFTGNASIFGKVYFPRLVMPISTVISQLISFGIQLAFFLCFWVYYLFTTNSIAPNWWCVAMFPLFIFQLALLGLGFGIIISACTTKYRDIAMLVGFGVQLWMYATPVAYDMSLVTSKFSTTLANIYMLNPVTPIINAVRYAFLGIGSFDLNYYLISWAVTLVVLFFGVLLFSRVEKTFMDTV